MTAALLMVSAGCDDLIPKVDIDDYIDAGAEDAGASEPEQDELAVPESIKHPAEGVHTASKYLEGAGEVVTRSGGLSIPNGALAAGADITVGEVDPSAIKASVPRVLEPVAPATAFTPHGQKFEQDVTLSLFYEADRSAKLVALRLDDENDTSWEVVDATFKDNVAFVTSRHFSIYTVTSCDPANDPSGFCSDLSSGAAKLDDLPQEEFVPYAPPVDFGGKTEPTQPDPVADAGEPEDAGVGTVDASAPAPDAGTKPEPSDAGSGGSVDPVRDASVPRVDASVPTFDGGSTQPDGGKGDAGPGDQACSWFEKCDPINVCEPIGGSPDGGGWVGPLKDGSCPTGYSRTVREQCHLEARCTPEWCATHPSDCPANSDAGMPDASYPDRDAGMPDYDASLPPTYDGGARGDAGGSVDPKFDGGAPPGCVLRQQCSDGYECRPGAEPVRDSGAGNCSQREICETPKCDIPMDCHQECGEQKVCDATGANCTSEPYCREACYPSPACPQPVCKIENFCGPALPCDDRDVVLVTHCYDVPYCEGTADAGVAGDVK